MTNKQKIENRMRINVAIRRFFSSNKYLEVETPCFVASPDMEPTLMYFETTCNTLDAREFKGALITSPEYSLKKLVSEKLPCIFELSRVFRNGEPVDDRHNPEFTMLEWYKLGVSFSEGITETKKLIEYIADVFNYRLGAWKFVTVQELFAEYCGINDLSNPTTIMYQDALDKLGLDWSDDDTISDLFQRLFLNRVQKHIDALPNPVIVAYYPQHEATLSRINNKGFAERFEIYINGLEICNAYGELTNAVEQRRRFLSEREERRRLGKAKFPIDDNLIDALKKIREPMFGNALGVERLLMVMLGAESIKDVILFTTDELFK